MAKLRVPIVVVVIGEGGSGGALALGVGDRILMMDYAVYSVISPEGCASILWKDATQAQAAASALKLTAPHLLDQGIIDAIVPEPLGGAHTSWDGAAAHLKGAILAALQELEAMSPEDLVSARYEKFARMGAFTA
jgi:acetyl-CoA carboxylase carboxyl transferase subunit alpha